MKLDLKVWVGSNEGWVDGGGSVRTRTRDGSAEWLACDDGAMCQGLVLGITGSTLSLLGLGSFSLSLSSLLFLSLFCFPRAELI